MGKLFVTTLLTVLTLTSSVWASEEVIAENKIRYYRCDATIAQRYQLFVGEDLEQVLDRSTCILASDTNISTALKSALESTSKPSSFETYPITSVESVDMDGAGLSEDTTKTYKIQCDGEDQECLQLGTRHYNTIKSIFVFNKTQISQVMANLMWAKKYKRDLSLYFMQHQTKFKNRGLPDPILLNYLEEAPIVVEATAH